MDINWDGDYEIIEDEVEEEEEFDDGEGIKADKGFIEKLETVKTGEMGKSVGIKEILMLREEQAPLLPYYLEEIKLPRKGFVYIKNMSFTTISELRPNLLRQPYWVIGNHGKMGGIHTGRLEFNEEVLEKYLNHVIVSHNWSLMDKLNRETFTIPIEFGDVTYDYKVRFASTLGKRPLTKYIDDKLAPIYDYADLSRIQAQIATDYKNIVEWVERFIQMKGYPFEAVVKSMRSKKNNPINPLVRMLTTKNQGNQRSNVQPVWRELVRQIVEDKSDAYFRTVMKNNIKNLQNLKTRKGKYKEIKMNYIQYYINDVDLFDLVYLERIFNMKDFADILVELEIYMNTDTRKLVRRRRGSIVH